VSRLLVTLTRYRRPTLLSSSSWLDEMTERRKRGGTDGPITRPGSCDSPRGAGSEVEGLKGQNVPNGTAARWTDVSSATAVGTKCDAARVSLLKKKRRIRSACWLICSGVTKNSSQKRRPRRIYMTRFRLEFRCADKEAVDSLLSGFSSIDRRPAD
jgi:hypothetical protein